MMQRLAPRGHFVAGAFSLLPFSPLFDSDDAWCFLCCFLCVVDVVAWALVTPTSMVRARATAVSVRIEDSPLGVAAPHGTGFRTMDARAPRKVKSTHGSRVADPQGRC